MQGDPQPNSASGNLAAAAGVQEGDVLAGKYRVDKVLGVGGMGVVVAAHHLQLDERVAIKFLLPDTLAHSELVMRFSREARAAVKIKSEHVARVTDVGTLENGAPYMVMEYLEGRDLEAVLASRGPLPVDQAVDFILQACEAIAEAHTLGIVHRDLKPANLFLARTPGGDRSVKVLDFGISKVTEGGTTGSQFAGTRAESLMGSPLYMSPEQMKSSRDVDARGDIWSLGVILYELLAGSPPFTAETGPELVIKITSEEPVRLRTYRPDVPEGLEAALGLCLEKDRDRRHQTVAALSIAIAPFGSRRSQLSVERISMVSSGAGPGNSVWPPPILPSSREGRTGGSSAFGRTIMAGGRRPISIGAAVVLLALGAGLLVVFMGEGASDEGPRSPAVLSPGPPAAPPRAEPPPGATMVATAPSPAGSGVVPAPSVEPAAAVSGTVPSRQGAAGKPVHPRPAAKAPRLKAAASAAKPSDTTLLDERY